MRDTTVTDYDRAMLENINICRQNGDSLHVAFNLTAALFYGEATQESLAKVSNVYYANHKRRWR